MAKPKPKPKRKEQSWLMKGSDHWEVWGKEGVVGWFTSSPVSQSQYSVGSNRPERECKVVNAQCKPLLTLLGKTVVEVRKVAKQRKWTLVCLQSMLVD